MRQEESEAGIFLPACSLGHVLAMALFPHPRPHLGLNGLLPLQDHPEHGVLFLVRELLNVIQDYTWEDNSDEKIRIYTCVLHLLSAMSQETYLYHIDKGPYVGALEEGGGLDPLPAATLELASASWEQPPYVPDLLQDIPTQSILSLNKPASKDYQSQIGSRGSQAIFDRQGMKVNTSLEEDWEFMPGTILVLSSRREKFLHQLQFCRPAKSSGSILSNYGFSWFSRQVCVEGELLSP
ncbi:hypothetical protein P7K49_023087 [Saguinus oedipus]|uniref:VPS35 endosomal protein-sorting factor-like n=1 Tax=Saguinus oedipus TaxID=9490 RepID=A0ABQ9UKN6_SAGOE|nr:hypothetical protein P7K49_023087 [Saguinus oedipus]